jgi:hypothetical protein
MFPAPLYQKVGEKGLPNRLDTNLNVGGFQPYQRIGLVQYSFSSPTLPTISALPV